MQRVQFDFCIFYDNLYLLYFSHGQIVYKNNNFQKKKLLKWKIFYVQKKMKK